MNSLASCVPVSVIKTHSTLTPKHREHSANSFFHGLWSDSHLGNMQLFFDCGYSLGKTDMQSLKAVCHQLRGNKTERRVYELLKDVSEKPQSLTTMCRRQVRRTLMETRCQHQAPMDAMIDSLPVPVAVKDFLSVREPSCFVQSQNAQ
jgi:hypothetical protein